MSLMSLAVNWTERGLVPDSFVRGGIRRLIRSRLSDLHATDCEHMMESQRRFVAAMREAEVAPLPDKANEQHYEVPARFFDLVLGARRKYSACYFAPGVESLDQAEEDSLRITCERAGIEDGQQILELGCGWGSLTLWMAEHYPSAQIVGVSNSTPQRQFIEAEIARRGIYNVEIRTADMNDFAIDQRFDRIVSIEMFEHMRNYDVLFRRVSSWLKDEGRFFMHIFCHRAAPYEFVVEDDTDWMSRYFFSGGIMPSDDLPLRFQRELRIVDTWRWSGVHYQKTAEAWLQNMDQRRDTVMAIIEQCYGARDAQQWWVRWRLFFMACAELFGYDNGQRWWVSHYLFAKQGQ